MKRAVPCLLIFAVWPVPAATATWTATVPLSRVLQKRRHLAAPSCVRRSRRAGVCAWPAASANHGVRVAGTGTRLRLGSRLLGLDGRRLVLDWRVLGACASWLLLRGASLRDGRRALRLSAWLLERFARSSRLLLCAASGCVSRGPTAGSWSSRWGRVRQPATNAWPSFRPCMAVRHRRACASGREWVWQSAPPPVHQAWERAHRPGPGRPPPHGPTAAPPPPTSPAHAAPVSNQKAARPAPPPPKRRTRSTSGATESRAGVREPGKRRQPDGGANPGAMR